MASDSPQHRPRLYEQVSGEIGAAIRSGALQAGDRVPSVRRFSAQHGVSVSTVVQAYAQLEAIGLVRARPQSGYYVRAQRELPETRATCPPQASSAVAVSDLVGQVYAACHMQAALGFGAAYTPFAMLPTRRLARLLAAAARSAEHGGAEYDMPPGNPALRQQIARRSVDWGCALAPDELLTTCGATEALNLCLLAVARRGDTIAIESPTFFGTLQMLEAHGLRALEIPCHPRDGMQVDALEAAIRRHRVAAVVTVANFSNPLGSCMPDANKERLVGLLARKGIPLIEDDIFGDLHFGPLRPKAAKSFDRRGLVLLCGSFSKTLAQGFRVGWVAGGRLHDRLQQLKFSQSVTTPTLPQRAIAAFLDCGGYDRHLRLLRRRLADSMRRVQSAVSEHFPAGTRMSKPTGGMVLWIELPPRVSSLELYRRALVEGIGVAPGPIFSARQRMERFVRLSTGLEWSEGVESGLRRLGKLVSEMA